MDAGRIADAAKIKSQRSEPGIEQAGRNTKNDFVMHRSAA
jgi:hypothetical protein